MNTYCKTVFLAFLGSAVFFTSCDDDGTIVVHYDESITTFNIVLIPLTGGDSKTVSFFDEDGEGGQEPLIGTLRLDANINYDATITMISESVNPSELIHLKVQSEDEDHQLFFSASGGANLLVSYQDEDENGNPLGLSTFFTAGTASEGELTVTLRYEPNKNAEGVAAGDITNAGGETDIEIVFPAIIE